MLAVFLSATGSQSVFQMQMSKSCLTLQTGSALGPSITFTAVLRCAALSFMVLSRQA